MASFRFTAALIVSPEGNLELYVNSPIALNPAGYRYQTQESLPVTVKSFLSREKRPTTQDAIDALRDMQGYLDKTENARRVKKVVKKSK